MSLKKKKVIKDFGGRVIQKGGSLQTGKPEGKWVQRMVNEVVLGEREGEGENLLGTRFLELPENGKQAGFGKREIVRKNWGKERKRGRTGPHHLPLLLTRNRRDIREGRKS